MRRGHQGIDVEHLLLALMEQEGGIAGSLLEQAGVSPAAVCLARSQALTKVAQVHGPGAAPGQIHLTPRLGSLLTKAEDRMKELRDDFVSVEHIILAMVEEGGIFRRLNLTRERLLTALQQVRGNQRVTSQDPEGTYQALEKYGRDLLKLAGQGKLDPVIGRDDEIRRTIQILSRRTKNNPSSSVSQVSARRPSWKGSHNASSREMSRKGSSKSAWSSSIWARSSPGPSFAGSSKND